MRSLFIALVLALGVVAPAAAEPTTVVVRALAKDAKFIGTSMGGVKVTLVRDGDGALLAEGVISGGTGDTARLVETPRARGAKLSGAGDAVFIATIDIEEPTLVRLYATASPTGGWAPIEVRSTAWILPGQPVVGDGWVVEFPGLAVSPSMSDNGDQRTITAKVVLMCGCPVTPGGLWDADQFDVRLLVDDLETPPKSFAMTYAGEVSTFSVTLDKPKTGLTRYRVTAFDKRTGNTGVGQAMDFGGTRAD